MSKDTHTLTAADFADILTTTLALAAEAGFSVGVQNRTANDGKPGGLPVFVSCLTGDAQCDIAATPAPQEEPQP